MIIDNNFYEKNTRYLDFPEKNNMSDTYILYF